ncbi:hypothetical protein BDW42DRAFT_31585 [Aspergillus taichungensis]|uniref:Uncharacterized protein n=1 Tax=Aspergillus taichungensis TaxID=482145 RepID=A0A2J5HFY1_9EURO|nr:hypothetical protein BDW42DRAFT_31585 [Aspergillus taichungensis]
MRNCAEGAGDCAVTGPEEPSMVDRVPMWVIYFNFNVDGGPRTTMYWGKGKNCCSDRSIALFSHRWVASPINIVRPEPSCLEYSRHTQDRLRSLQVRQLVQRLDGGESQPAMNKAAPPSGCTDGCERHCIFLRPSAGLLSWQELSRRGYALPMA